MVFNNKTDLLSFLNALPDAALLLRVDQPIFTIEQANDAHLNFTRSAREDVIGNGVFEVYQDNPDNNQGMGAKSLKKSLIKVVQTGERDTLPANRYDIKIKGSDHFHEKYWATVNTPVLNKEGEPEFILHSVKDVTEKILIKKKFEEKKKKGSDIETILSQAEEMALMGSWELDLKTNSIFWSDGVYEICGYKPDEFKLTFDSALGVIHPEDRDKTIKEMQRAIQEKRDYKIRKRFVCKGKQIKEILSKGKVIIGDDGEPVKLIGIFQDITARLNLEKREEFVTKEHRKAQKLLQETQEVAKIGGWEVDLVEDKLYWSSMVKKIHEVDPDYEPNLEEAIQFYLEGKNRERIELAVEEAVRDGKGFDVELQIRTAKGNIKWVRATGKTEIKEGKAVRIYGATQDITDHKETELALLDSKIKYQSLVESVNGIVWEAKADTFEFTFISDKSLEILGYDPEEWYKDKQFWSRNIHPDDRIETVNYCKEMTAKGKDHNSQYRMINKKGEEVWIRDIVSVISQNGKPELLRGVMFDITKIKHSEEEIQKTIAELRARNQFIETALENLPIGIAVNKIDTGEVQLMNTMFSEIYGWPKEDLNDVNTFFECVYPDPEYRAEISEMIMEDISSGDPDRMEWSGITVTTKGGEQRIVKAKNIPLPEQNLMISTVIDTTEQVEREKKLEQLSLVASKTAEVVMILDPDGFIVWVNNAFTTVTGYDQNKVIGKAPGDLLSGPETDPVTEKRIHDALAESKSIQTEIINYTKSGKKYWAEVRLDPVFNEGGECTAYIAIAADITKRKRRDLQLIRSLKEKEVLLSEIHHRVKNNLAVVSSMMQIQMLEEEGDEVDSRFIDSISRIKTIATIHEILYQSGSFSELDFSEIIEMLINNIHKTFSIDKEVEVNIIKDPIQLTINQAIPCALVVNEVVTNIFKHAFKDTDSGRIDVEVKDVDDLIELIIKDNGCGIPDDFNLESSSSLGMHIIEALSVQLEGEYALESLDQGTIFSMNFERSDISGIGRGAFG